MGIRQHVRLVKQVQEILLTKKGYHSRQGDLEGYSRDDKGRLRS